ncbi:MAG: adenylate kinase [Acidobacteria bacterium]|nr:adenylate kinase [Acidobacteriota bacterium]MCG3192489.1 adenylate kinase [Thermoanaerobaculia bacterium]MCK6683322.1 adenylate kinase [Thermoanaerobaculia bacterium]
MGGVAIVFFGPPGSGKGTQASRLAQKMQLPQISTGDLLRYHVGAGTEIGKIAKPIMESGNLVPDELVTQMLRERLKQDDAICGALFDGYPRTTAQARSLDALLAETGKSVLVVLHVDVPDEAIVDRLAKRAQIEGRADDTPETIRARLRVYREKTAPVAGYYEAQGLLVTIDGDRTIDEVFSEVDSVVYQRLVQPAPA